MGWSDQFRGMLEILTYMILHTDPAFYSVQGKFSNKIWKFCTFKSMSTTVTDFLKPRTLEGSEISQVLALFFFCYIHRYAHINWEIILIAKEQKWNWKGMRGKKEWCCEKYNRLGRKLQQLLAWLKVYLQGEKNRGMLSSCSFSPHWHCLDSMAGNNKK